MQHLGFRLKSFPCPTDVEKWTTLKWLNSLVSYRIDSFPSFSGPINEQRYYIYSRHKGSNSTGSYVFAHCPRLLFTATWKTCSETTARVIRNPFIVSVGCNWFQWLIMSSESTARVLSGGICKRHISFQLRCVCVCVCVCACVYIDIYIYIYIYIYI